MPRLGRAFCGAVRPLSFARLTPTIWPSRLLTAVLSLALVSLTACGSSGDVDEGGTSGGSVTGSGDGSGNTETADDKAAQAYLALAAQVAGGEEAGAQAVTAGELRTAYEGNLQAWVQATDAALGRSDDSAITALLEADTDEDVAAVGVVAKVQESMLAQLRDRLGAATNGFVNETMTLDEQLAALSVARSLMAAFVPLAEVVDASALGAGDTTKTTIATGFDNSANAMRQGDSYGVQAAKQVVEKTLWRVLDRSLRLAVVDAKIPAAGTENMAATPAQLRAQRRALGFLHMLKSRISGKHTPGYGVAEAMLNGSASPSAIDVEAVHNILNVVWSKRTCSYTNHVFVRDPMGSAEAAAKAVEGHTYFKMIAADLLARQSERSPQDVEGWWQAWQDALLQDDLTAAQGPSNGLEGLLCAYQAQLGVSGVDCDAERKVDTAECVTADEPALEAGE